MILLGVLVLLGTMAVTGERHSLTYIYTAFSRPVGLPGIHEFTAMGLLDDRMIDYFDSNTKVKVPKEDWMKERLPEDYWEKGTQSRQSKQQWFKVNINILKERLRQNDTDVHVLQWRHGCEGEELPDGKIKFTRGMDMYNYDGNDFLSFDDANEVWVAPDPAAVQTKRKWDEVQVLKEYTKGYLENECVDWMEKFLTYQGKKIKAAVPPKVFLYTRKAKVDAHVVLMCMATGFYPKDIILRIKRDDRVLSEEDGLVSTGIRPNEDATYQRTDSVEILRSDSSIYTCEVRHDSSRVHLVKEWDHTLLPDTGLPMAIVGGVLGVILLVVVIAGILIILYKKGVIRNSSNANQGSNPSLESDNSGRPLQKPKVSPDGSESSSLMENNGAVNEEIPQVV